MELPVAGRSRPTATAATLTAPPKTPTGPLSGVTTLAIIVWLMSWLALSRLWQGRTVTVIKVNTTGFAFLALGFLLTFPPFMDLLQGK
jgi:hypothetical protein